MARCTLQMEKNRLVISCDHVFCCSLDTSQIWIGVKVANVMITEVCVNWYSDFPGS